MKAIIDAVNAENTERVVKLIPDSDLSVVDDYGESCLHLAVLKGNIEMVTLLLENGIDVNMQNKKGNTPLHYAADLGHTSIAELILKNGGRLDIENSYGNEPLWSASFNDKGFGRRLDMIKLFLLYKADKNHKSANKLSAVDFAQKANYQNILQLFNG